MAKNTIERFDAEGNIIAMSDAELDALDARRRRMALVLGTVGLAAALATVLALSLFLKIGGQGRSALEDVTQFSPSQPTQVGATGLRGLTQFAASSASPSGRGTVPNRDDGNSRKFRVALMSSMATKPNARESVEPPQLSPMIQYRSAGLVVRFGRWEAPPLASQHEVRALPT